MVSRDTLKSASGLEHENFKVKSLSLFVMAASLAGTPRRSSAAFEFHHASTSAGPAQMYIL